MKRKFMLSNFIGAMVAMCLPTVLMVAAVIKTVFLFVYEPVAHLLDVRRKNEVVWSSYRPVRYIVKSTNNLYRSQGRNYCWQAGKEA